ncbi:hypothetical protein CI109_102293 [Kwoniella shandongensis]|uniref:Uncharacterized protein n=1 Tax=Kwoniella shandongensis TaxID=1734106 RepID=A0A5M6BP60_9TREE|nr:uncharacterized protein CI109_007123 [Kwoniella shandongensis]KAA5524523.1 hypothetical protein CI109_007123 [Kwoniella shandongensis]
MVEPLHEEIHQNISQLPLDVLGNIVALIPPPFYSSIPPTEPTTTPLPEVLDAIDPTPYPKQNHTQLISAFSRSSVKCLEAARPWLWENVDVRSGRGWLAIVNALTEEVVEVENTSESITPASSGGAVAVAGPSSTTALPISIQPVSGPEAHRAPATISQGYIAHTLPPVSSSFAYPNGSSSLSAAIGSINVNIPTQYAYSPPQPSHIHMLLTPPTSRNASPHHKLSVNPHPEQPPTATTSIITSPTTLAYKTSLRGRSRSPRRNVGFDTESIDAVVDRSASTSSHGSGGSRKGFLQRRSSLSRSRVWNEHEIHDDEEEEEADEVPPLAAAVTARLGVITARTAGNVENNPHPDLLPPPGPYIRHLNFTNFRTIGSRRTQDEAVRGRFVTAGRLEGVIKNAPNLVSLLMTEYVDSALSYFVIEELFFRGSRRPRVRSPSKSLSRVRSLSIGPALSVTSTTHDQLDPPRPTYVPYEDETEDQKWNRRAMFTPLEALDLTGCVSPVFHEAMTKFFYTWLAPDEDTTEDEDTRGRGRGRSRRKSANGLASPEATEDESEAHGWRHSPRRTPRFRSIRRLCLRMCTSLEPAVITGLVFACPSLTHLDLSNTKVPNELLIYLTESCPRNVRLTSLSLARCPRLDSRVIVDFICESPATRDLIDLNLFVNPTQGKAIEGEDLMRLIKEAPCIKSGKLRYLDLSSAKFTSAHLAKDVFPPQPTLISLGLSHIPTLSLPPIADFLLNVAPSVEILTLAGTASTSSLGVSQSSLQLTLELHARLINPLTTVPFSLSNLNLSGGVNTVNLNPGPTRLRVIELIRPVRHLIATNGSGEWKVVKSKGGRGWYVDLSAGWRHDPTKPGEMEFVRHLPRTDERRQWLNELAEAGGRVGSNVGWHSRKMEVIRGMGMINREEGMAGAGAYAFEE